jgi:hypothetical protein
MDAKMLARVRALLAKAESTTFEEEATALTAKAQELIARYSLDDALLAAAGGDPTDPHERRVLIEAPYATAKFHLLGTVADANRCTVVLMQPESIASVFGYPFDLDATDVLFTSLLVQATTQVLAAGPRQDGFGRSTTRSFRRSFLLAYADRIGERLQAATDAATAATARGDELLPILASRSAEVAAARDRAFPHVTTVHMRASHPEGWRAGRAAADRADLASRRAVDRSG